MAAPTAAARPSQEALREAIRAINNDATLSSEEKVRRTQALMSGAAAAAVAANERASLPPRPRDDEDSFFDAERKIFGCRHYRRNCRLRAPCCNIFYPCRYCHDEHEDHRIDRQQKKEMLCLFCRTAQPTAQYCRNPSCRKQMGRYFCPICNLVDDAPDKNIYHCDKCGLCRVGRAAENFHCNTCNACLPLSLRGNHKCLPRALGELAAGRERRARLV